MYCLRFQKKVYTEELSSSAESDVYREYVGTGVSVFGQELHDSGKSQPEEKKAVLDAHLAENVRETDFTLAEQTDWMMRYGVVSSQPFLDFFDYGNRDHFAILGAGRDAVDSRKIYYDHFGQLTFEMVKEFNLYPHGDDCSDPSQALPFTQTVRLHPFRLKNGSLGASVERYDFESSSPEAAKKLEEHVSGLREISWEVEDFELRQMQDCAKEGLVSKAYHVASETGGVEVGSSEDNLESEGPVASFIKEYSTLFQRLISTLKSMTSLKVRSDDLTVTLKAQCALMASNLLRLGKPYVIVNALLDNVVDMPKDVEPFSEISHNSLQEYLENSKAVSHLLESVKESVLERLRSSDGQAALLSPYAEHTSEEGAHATDGTWLDLSGAWAEIVDANTQVTRLARGELLKGAARTGAFDQLVDTLRSLPDSAPKKHSPTTKLTLLAKEVQDARQAWFTLEDTFYSYTQDVYDICHWQVYLTRSQVKALSTSVDAQNYDQQFDLMMKHTDVALYYFTHFTPAFHEQCTGFFNVSPNLPLVKELEVVLVDYFNRWLTLSATERLAALSEMQSIILRAPAIDGLNTKVLLAQIEKEKTFLAQRYPRLSFLPDEFKRVNEPAQLKSFYQCHSPQAVKPSFLARNRLTVVTVALAFVLSLVGVLLTVFIPALLAIIPAVAKMVATMTLGEVVLTAVAACLSATAFFSAAIIGAKKGLAAVVSKLWPVKKVEVLVPALTLASVAANWKTPQNIGLTSKEEAAKLLLNALHSGPYQVVGFKAFSDDSFISLVSGNAELRFLALFTMKPTTALSNEACSKLFFSAYEAELNSPEPRKALLVKFWEKVEKFLDHDETRLVIPNKAFENVARSWTISADVGFPSRRGVAKFLLGYVAGDFHNRVDLEVFENEDFIAYVKSDHGLIRLLLDEVASQANRAGKIPENTSLSRLIGRVEGKKKVAADKQASVSEAPEPDNVSVAGSDLGAPLRASATTDALWKQLRKQQPTDGTQPAEDRVVKNVVKVS